MAVPGSERRGETIRRDDYRHREQEVDGAEDLGWMDLCKPCELRDTHD